MIKYYIAIEGSKQGPFTLDELKEKQISRTTLIWTEGMSDWTEAKNVQALNDLHSQSPPPIPKPPQEKLITPKTEVIVAKETKSFFQQIFYGLIIGTISFAVFYYVIYNAPKYDNFDYSKIKYQGNEIWGAPNISDFPFPCYAGSERRQVEERKRIYTEKSAYAGLYTFLIASGLLIVIRYASKGAKWVNETSKKDI